MSENEQIRQVFIGETLQQPAPAQASGEYISLHGERFYLIRDVNAIAPFFMSLVSSSDHWLFIASTGGLSAGRVSAEQALFPYYTVDKITENYENTGVLAILLVLRSGRWHLWEPFSLRQQGQYHIQRNLYKNIPGTTLIFEEINLDLEVTFRYAWRTSDRFGFIKTSWLINDASSVCEVELLDGLQNLLPANISSHTQNIFSVLLDAYKRSELDPQTGLGIYALSSNLTDLAEPSEALRATTVAQLGLDGVDILLSTQQLDAFRHGQLIHAERDARGQRAAYLAYARQVLEPGAQRSWHLVAEVNQNHVTIAALRKALKDDPQALLQALEADMAANQANLVKIVASADGLQLSQDLLGTSHHFANVLFNVLRGGIFAEGYWIHTTDLQDFMAVHRPALLKEYADFFAGLPDRIQVSALQARAAATGSIDLLRLCTAYLPLTFSRRHGDPSRPWNQFMINVKKPDGTQRLDYQGNWRDIFQNWEALAWAYPEFVENMLSVFLNATTLDGYNPYRVTRNGLDWEVPEPHNPWANIGYWSDHQMIYLLKLMEVSVKVHPEKLQQWLTRPIFSYANVPYRIKPYANLIHDPYSTIDFNWELQHTIEAKVREGGQDGKLVCEPDGQVFHTNLAEKLLTLLLAKLVNFVPEGGIWMNTQRPEWNDANNALVGKGLSVVTLFYLRRYLVFCRELFVAGLHTGEMASIPLLQEVASFFGKMDAILQRFHPLLSGPISDEQRREVMDALGQAGSDYRWGFYQHGISGALSTLPVERVVSFLDLALSHVEHTLRVNKRSDHLFHAYNILHLSDRRAAVSHLSEMLEGQVAALSSGLLSNEEALALLDSLRAGPLYRADQNSYILYPDRELPGFLEKNHIPNDLAQKSKLVQALVAARDQSLMLQDINGDYHFAGELRNIKDVNRVLEALTHQPRFAGLVAMESEDIRSLFEAVFHHNQFTGRSGTFFAYEGLGSIYWHMVSKLLLAVQETALRAKNSPDGLASSHALKARYTDIRQGLGFNKSPAIYGAFPTDPYSHTPKGQGAKQPGMTGQVKEEILTRQAELGLFVQQGGLVFDSFLLDPAELLAVPAVFNWFDVSGQPQSLDIPVGSLAFTFCQVPILLQLSDEAHIEVHRADGGVELIAGNMLDLTNSQHIFKRDGLIHHLNIFLLPQK
jgi:hypothetical protein